MTLLNVTLIPKKSVISDVTQCSSVIGGRQLTVPTFHEPDKSETYCKRFNNSETCPKLSDKPFRWNVALTKLTVARSILQLSFSGHPPYTPPVHRSHGDTGLQSHTHQTGLQQLTHSRQVSQPSFFIFALRSTNHSSVFPESRPTKSNTFEVIRHKSAVKTSADIRDRRQIFVCRQYLSIFVEGVSYRVYLHT